MCNSIKNIWDRYIINFFKSNPIEITISFFIFTIIFAFIYHNEEVFSILVASFGSIFIALKYKLDQANYHKDLFEKRFEIFRVIDKVLWEWASHRTLSREQENKIGGDLMRKSYYLFGADTYQHIAKIREAIIYVNSYAAKRMSASTVKSDDEADFYKKVQKQEEFLRSLIDNQSLADKFPELKINSY